MEKIGKLIMLTKSKSGYIPPNIRRWNRQQCKLLIHSFSTCITSGGQGS